MRISSSRALVRAGASVAICGLWIGGMAGRDLSGAHPQTLPVPQPRTTASIAGHIELVDATSAARPVRWARVTLAPEADAGAGVTTTSDADGSFRFDDVAGGHRYLVAAAKPGFLVDPSATGETFREVVPTLGHTTDIIVPMHRAAALEGRTLDRSGTPLRNLIVSAVRARDHGGSRAGPVSSCRTDDLGRFRLATLPAGSYYVTADTNPLQEAIETIRMDRLASGPVKTYYPGTVRVSEARPVALSTGQAIRDLDFVVENAVLATVTVTVESSAGIVLPASTFDARLRPLDPAEMDVKSTFDGRDATEVAFKSVRPGDYWLLVATPGRAGPEFAAQALTVASNDNLNLTLATTTGVTVSGRIEVDDPATPLPAGLRVAAKLDAPELQLSGGTDPTAAISVDARGAFVLTNLVGSGSLQIENLPPGWSIAHVFIRDVDQTNRSLAFAALGSDVRILLARPH